MGVTKTVRRLETPTARGSQETRADRTPGQPPHHSLRAAMTATGRHLLPDRTAPPCLPPPTQTIWPTPPLAAAGRELAGPSRPAGPAAALPTVAVVGLGYVGLPTALALQAAAFPVIGLDISERRLAAIAGATADLLARDRALLIDALDSGRLAVELATWRRIGEADIVIIAVPTPVDDELNPDPRAVHAACASVVEHARAGQTIILTSTTYVGTTRTQLVEPLAERGLIAGRDVHVAFAPERILPGDESVSQTETPRVLGGVTPACTQAARSCWTPSSSGCTPCPRRRRRRRPSCSRTPSARSTWRSPTRWPASPSTTGWTSSSSIDAAATKPYGFLAHYPGAGIGGHCIPVDPYYLLAPLAQAGVATPIATTAMRRVARVRPTWRIAPWRYSPSAASRPRRRAGPGGRHGVQAGRRGLPGVAGLRITRHLAARGVRSTTTTRSWRSAEIPGVGTPATPSPARWPPTTTWPWSPPSTVALTTASSPIARTCSMPPTARPAAGAGTRSDARPSGSSTRRCGAGARTTSGGRAPAVARGRRRPAVRPRLRHGPGRRADAGSRDPDDSRHARS